jgi:hypothetical protein
MQRDKMKTHERNRSPRLQTSVLPSNCDIVSQNRRLKQNVAVHWEDAAIPRGESVVSFSSPLHKAEPNCRMGTLLGRFHERVVIRVWIMHLYWRLKALDASSILNVSSGMSDMYGQTL